MRQKQSCYNKSQLASLRNTLMQLRKNSNHPDLVQAPFEQDPNFPPVEVLLERLFVADSAETMRFPQLPLVVLVGQTR